MASHDQLVQADAWDTEARVDGLVFKLGCPTGTASIVVTPAEAYWFSRNRHPSRRERIGPVLEKLAGRVTTVVVRSEGPNHAAAHLVAMTPSGVSEAPVSLAMAVLLVLNSGLPLLIDEALFDDELREEIDIAAFRLELEGRGPAG
jgi:hypothetical protein